jgi:DNA-binding MarR family transcriptional regulator
MFDYDPREQDARERDDGVRDREEDWVADRRDDRDRGSRDREDPASSLDPRDVFSHDLDLPRGCDRELVRDRDHEYRLNGCDVRTLSTVGAFRLVAERDLRDPRDASFDVRDHDLRHLEKQGLIQRVPLDGRERAVALTDHGRGLLEGRRERDTERSQRFYSGADRPRERTHDALVYRAYLKAAERLRDRDARILRVSLDRELKRAYQRFLQDRNRGDRDSDGRPDRTVEEIQDWAREHDLPYFDDQVHFPDVRIEYEDVNGDVRREDLEVTTEHYRGAHGSAAARSGFSIHASGGGGRSAPFDPRAAEEFL